MFELLAWVILLCLLFRVLAKLTDIYALIRPDAPAPPSLLMMPRLMLRKGMFTLYGAVYLFLSKDKIGKSQLARAPDADDIASRVDSEVRIIFIRHGESMWNLVFNRGFGPSFLVRLVKAVLYELYLIPFDDSCFLDSPLSDLGFEQCHSLQAFLRNPCLDPSAQADFDVLTAGEGRSVIVSSQLRRAAATAAIGLADRLKRTNEPILMHSSCQEISRNFDTMSITEAGKGPTLRGSAELERKLHYDGTANKGSKGLGFRGMHRIEDFAAWAAKRNESTIIVAGHSLWFKEFFKLYLPRAADHTCKKKKIVNCGAVGFTLQTASPRGVALSTLPVLRSRPRAARPPSRSPSRPPSPPPPRRVWPSGRAPMQPTSSLAAAESAWPASSMLLLASLKHASLGQPQACFSPHRPRFRQQLAPQDRPLLDQRHLRRVRCQVSTRLCCDAVETASRALLAACKNAPSALTPRGPRLGLYSWGTWSVGSCGVEM